MLLNDLLSVIAFRSEFIITERNLDYDVFSEYNEEPEYTQLFNSHVDRYSDLKNLESKNYLVEIVYDTDIGIRIVVFKF